MGYAKTKRKKGRFLGIPHHIAASDAYCELGAQEVKLLMDLLFQYNGSNNGDLFPTYSLMKDRGWEGKKGSLYRAKDALLQNGFISVTRQGWKERGKPTLVAITWNGIDEPRKGLVYDEGVTPSYSA